MLRGKVCKPVSKELEQELARLAQHDITVNYFVRQMRYGCADIAACLVACIQQLVAQKEEVFSKYVKMLEQHSPANVVLMPVDSVVYSVKIGNSKACPIHDRTPPPFQCPTCPIQQHEVAEMVGNAMNTPNFVSAVEQTQADEPVRVERRQSDRDSPVEGVTLAGMDRPSSMDSPKSKE